MSEKYPSKFSPGKLVPIDKLLAEIICDRQAKSKGIDLPLQFWKTSDFWEKEFLHQLRGAKLLLQLFSKEAISTALKSKKGKKVTSLSAPFLTDIIKEEQRKIDLREKINQEVESDREEVQVPSEIKISRPEFKKKNKLENLD